MVTLTKKRAADSYLRLVRAWPLRRLRSAAEHAKASEVYLKLSSRRADRGTRDYLDVLADVIAEYERRTEQTIDASDLTAADLVRHRLEERGLSVSALAREIGVPQPNLSEMLNGRRDWSKAVILALSRTFNIRAERFLT
jgi:HTH-type transcriptional regulator / antitoxin HigA